MADDATRRNAKRPASASAAADAAGACRLKLHSKLFLLHLLVVYILHKYIFFSLSFLWPRELAMHTRTRTSHRRKVDEVDAVAAAGDQRREWMQLINKRLVDLQFSTS